MHRFRLPCYSPAGDEGGGGGGAPPPTVPKADHDKLLARIAEIEAKEAERAASAKKADEDAAAKRGEYEKLHGAEKQRADAAEAKLKDREKAENARLEKVKARTDARVAKLSPALKAAVAPLAASLSPDALADWIDEHLPALEEDAERPAGTRSRDTKGKVDVPPECVTEWEKYGKHLGLTAEQWFENNKTRFAAKKTA